MQRSTTPDLPDLDQGVHLLDVDGGRPHGPLFSLVLDHLLTADGTAPALWVDPGDTANAQRLARLAPSPRLLDRIDVARGFTPHQHLALINAATERASAETPLVVVPGVDVQYRSDECPRGTAEAAIEEIARQLDRLARTTACPILVERRRNGSLVDPVAAVATETITVTQTKCGSRFLGDSFETTVYPVDGPGKFLQTTLAFWAEVLEHRARACETQRDPIRGSGTN